MHEMPVAWPTARTSSYGWKERPEIWQFERPAFAPRRFARAAAVPRAAEAWWASCPTWWRMYGAFALRRKQSFHTCTCEPCETATRPRWEISTAVAGVVQMETYRQRC